MPAGNHMFVRMAGFGLVVTPQGPFRATRSGDHGETLDVELASRRFARIIPEDGGFRSQIDKATTVSVYDVADIHSHEHAGEWLLQTTLFSCQWPATLQVTSVDDPAFPCPFELISSEGLRAYVQLPGNVPDLGQMAAEGQSIVDLVRSADIPSVTLAYEWNAEPWMQRHSLVSVGGRQLVLTAQFPEPVSKANMEILKGLERTFEGT